MSTIIAFYGKLNVGMRAGTEWEETVWRDLYMLCALHTFFKRRYVALSDNQIGNSNCVKLVNVNAV